MIAENKIKAACILTVCVGICVFFWLTEYENDLIAFLKTLIGQTTTISCAMIFIFDKWLWKIFPGWFLGIPKVYGTWKGKLGHSQVIESGGKLEGFVEPFFLCIRQNFSSLTIHAISEQSNSRSTMAGLKKGDIGWELIYTYDSDPFLRYQENSRKHRGAAVIQIQKADKGKKLVGEYWTDRWSQGYMELDGRNKIFATNFSDAIKIFSRKRLLLLNLKKYFKRIIS